MKKIILSLILGICASVASAVDFAYTIRTNLMVLPLTTVPDSGQGTNINVGPLKLTSLSIENTSPTNNFTLYFYDAPRTNTAVPFAKLSWTNVAYTSFTSFVTNRYLGDYTDYSGRTNYTRYQSNVIYTATNTVAAANNAYRLVYTVTATSNSTTTVTIPDAGWVFAMGLNICMPPPTLTVGSGGVNTVTVTGSYEK